MDMQFSMLLKSKICCNNIELNSFCNSVSRLCVGTDFHLKIGKCPCIQFILDDL